MDITEIIKEAFIFPSNDIGKLAIYIVLMIIFGGLIAGSTVTSIFGLIDSFAYLGVGIILFIISLFILFIILGYQVSIIKSGIDQEEMAPDFAWKENLITGVKYIIVNIVYYIIPAIIVIIVAAITNLHGNAFAIINELQTSPVIINETVNATAPAVSTISNALMSNFASSLAIVGVVALVLFIIFSFIQTMAGARLANTGSLSESLNIVEAFKDIGRIGWGKVIGTIILVIIVTVIVNGIISLISNYVPAIGIVSIIVTPYLVFFAARAMGSLYADIA